MAGGPVASTCVSEDPELLVTVSGASGTINWVGETWNLPADSGVQKTVCPTSYYLRQGLTTTGSYQKAYGDHWWLNNGLALIRGYAVIRNVTGPWYPLFAGHVWLNWITLQGVATDYVKPTFISGTSRPLVPTAAPSVYPAELGLITTLANASYSDYKITDDYFGSHVISGVTYTWAKGNGWP